MMLAISMANVAGTAFAADSDSNFGAGFSQGKCYSEEKLRAQGIERE